GRPRIPGRAASPGDAHLDSGRAGSGTGTSAARSGRNSEKAGRDSRCEVRGAGERNADGRLRFGVGLHLRARQDLPRQRYGAAEALQKYFSWVFGYGRDAIDRGAGIYVERGVRTTAGGDDFGEFSARDMGHTVGGPGQAIAGVLFDAVA